jgi:ankyrin repeat protein
MLIECGADLTTQNNYGWTPLHFASQMGHILLEHGANSGAHDNVN